MNIDWKDALKSLQENGSLPEGEETPVTAEEDESKGKNNDRLEVVTDRKGRKGKTATIIAGFTCDEEELKEIAAALKQKLGTGGSARGGEILIQGDRKNDIIKILNEMGYKTR